MEREVSSQRIQYAGAPTISKAGREILAFHLYRYLSPWLRELGYEHVMVTVGYEHSEADLGAYRISASEAQPISTGWSHADLEDAWRFGNGRLVWEGTQGAPIVFEVVAIFDEENLGVEGSRHLGFILLRHEEGMGEGDYERLASYAAEAICVARRNGVRLFFDEETDRPVKNLLYAVMDRLPEWVGVDHSTSVLLTDNLDAMTLEETSGGMFNVLAERIFFADPDEKASGRDRLVGMTVMAGGQPDSLLRDAMERHRRDPNRLFLLYRRDESAHSATWSYDGEYEDLQAFYELSDRPAERTLVMVPLVHQTRGERDLLGFLTLAWRGEVELTPSTHQVLRECVTDLARLLRRSPLYTLSVRKMWVVGKVRERLEAYIGEQKRGSEAMEDAIGDVSALVARHVDVPSFAIGYLQGEMGARVLRYVHAHGWTHFDDLELRVDVAPDERLDSGISALAIRMNRPVVLAGGHGKGADQEFKNFLWVDEDGAEIYDSRNARRSIEELEKSCRRLRDYYKPARDTAYASLAYPIVFSDILLGVLTVEVEKTTDWLWWTGFGGQLFWQMVAREMAMGLYWLRR